MDVPGGECDTMLDARRQMQPSDVTGERCEVRSLIGLHHRNPPPPPPSSKL